MSQVVVDASVAAKWFLPEKDSEKAMVLLDGRQRLFTPDLIYAEYGNILWKQHGRGALDSAQAADRVDRLLKVHSSGPLLAMAIDSAIQTRRTVYDCLYVALAVRQGCRMITADQRLVNALAGGPLERYVRWIGDT